MNEQEYTFTCVLCHDRQRITLRVDESVPANLAASVCWECSQAIPESLMRATVSVSTYTLELRTGTHITFRSARLRRQYAHLNDPIDGERLFPNGVEVRISDIVWCGVTGRSLIDD